MPKFYIGDRVEKARGYRWPGVVIGIVRTTAGHTRYVVECTVPEVAGALHIYSEDQLEHSPPIAALEAEPEPANG